MIEVTKARPGPSARRCDVETSTDINAFRCGWLEYRQSIRCDRTKAKSKRLSAVRI